MPRIAPFRNLLGRREAAPRSGGWVEPQNEITRALSGSALVRPAHSSHSAGHSPGHTPDPNASHAEAAIEIFARDTLGVDRPGHSHPDRL